MSEKTMRAFYHITITGRLCYIFMCIERYLITLYPDRDWTIVAEKMWQWTAHSPWDESCDIYSEVVPEYIFEFDGYEETNRCEYEGKLKREDYEETTSLFRGITNSDDKDEICQVLVIPCRFSHFAECSSLPSIEKYTAELIDKLESILQKHGIQLPDKSALQPFTFKREEPMKSMESMATVWGNLVNTECLSIILNP